MKIKHLILGQYENNCYVLRKSSDEKKCLIIDTGLENAPLLNYLSENNLEPIAIVFTHGHIDHIAGLLQLRKKYPKIKVYIHKLDAEMLTNAKMNLSILAGLSFETSQADVIVEDGDKINEAEIKLDVLHTPGHTQGGISLYCPEDNIIFTGDTLFADSVGRTDLNGGSMTELIESITQKLLNLEDKTVVYPGHGPKTTIGHEKKYNQYLQ